MYKLIITEEEDHVKIIRLNRKEALNALSFELMAELGHELGVIARENDIRVAIITGDERAFCAGVDLKEFHQRSAVEAKLRDHGDLWKRLQELDKPIIAAVSGYCLGGGLELAMACDIIIASETAKLGQPEIGVGLIPGAGGTQRLTRLIGKHRSMEMILTGKHITAVEAEKMGLVNKVVAGDALLPESKALAKQLAAKPPLALKAAKRAILTAYEDPIASGLGRERNIFSLLFASQDKTEGVQAFLEKRKPEFTGS